MPTPRSSGARAVTSSSPKKILPEVGVSSPQIMFSVVDFPQPEGPSSPTSMPSGISKVKSSTAITSPWAFLPRAGNRLVRFSSVIFIENSISLGCPPGSDWRLPREGCKIYRNDYTRFFPASQVKCESGAPHLPKKNGTPRKGIPFSFL